MDKQTTWQQIVKDRQQREDRQVRETLCGKCGNQHSGRCRREQ